MSDAEEIKIACPNCEGRNITRYIADDQFEYGIDPDAVTLNVKIPVEKCVDCEYEFTTHEADTIRHNAVCEHLGVLTPEEVRSIRGEHSQEEFSRISGLGKASLARWESGALLQNTANANFLHLLSFPENIERLKLKLESREKK